MEVSQGPPPMRGDPLESPELNWGGVPIGVCSRHWESAAVLPTVMAITRKTLGTPTEL